MAEPRDLLWFLSEGGQRTVVGVHHFDPLPPSGTDAELVERVNDLARMVNLLSPQLIGRTLPRVDGAVTPLGEQPAAAHAPDAEARE